MMMAPDSNGGPSGRETLAPATVDAVRHALGHYAQSAGEAQPAPSALGDALRTMAREARQKHILAEHLLLALKEIWYSLPEVRDAPNADDQTRLLQRLVTMCVREYYAGDE